MKLVLGALAAVTLFVGVAASQPAEARCFWNGYGMECFNHPHWGYWHHRDWDRWHRPHWGY